MVGRLVPRRDRLRLAADGDRDVGHCVDAGACFLGGSVDAGTKRIRQLLDNVEAKPLPANGRTLAAGNAVLGIWAPLYSEGNWGYLDTALKAAFAGDGAPLMSLSDAYVSRGPDGYTDDPTRAFYNHVWVVGDQAAISVEQQAEVDELAELAKIGGGE